ncbi:MULTISPECIES: alpha-L-fucosidase [unclassified Spirosoma]|uniref:alpha-L-fucosidase n=1 Tax=unclassified Spirosoma TaxID=2621999 RepID=UPI00095B4E67|nr:MULTISPECIES: alpha-L-fucosidase [unclassified Spirosoma]MBN8825740.1 alpha-L-fucosidase [Spirosoma sp.]OJW76572.1 MAG: alpha-L-fucosidase [Spirosoma sp. 48-14]
MRQHLFSLWLILSLAFYKIGLAQPTPPQPVGPLPSDNQLRWQHMEYYAFIHFSINTYTDMAWGLGNEDPKLFNPTKLDCRQWARICKEAGMKGIIFTAKHHSGFCLWPSKYTEYSVKNVPWRNGKADVVRELADACKEYGLKFGVYLSPWDRNHPDYGKSEYITYFRNQLTELLTNYGDIFEVWFDGANGGSGYYGGANETRKIDAKTYYDWPNTYKLVRKLQPKIVIWNDGGDRADLRWVGTEAGYVGETNWSLLNATGDVPEQMLRHGVENGNAWVPGEVNTSIRPEWFYHEREDRKVKTLPQLMDIYYHSIGRNATLLLNFPIMPNGLIHEKDEQAVQAFAKATKEAFAVNLARNTRATSDQIRGKSAIYAASKAIDGDKESYWATDDAARSASLTLQFSKLTAFNRFLVQEPIRLGQRVKAFTVEAFVDGNWKEIAKETTIGYKRILRFPTVEATQLRLNILDAKGCPLISNLEVYKAPLILTPPIITRDQAGDIHIKSGDTESEVYYTLDGSTPTAKSNQYTAPVKTSPGKVDLKAITYNPFTKQSSVVSDEKFDIARSSWKILSTEARSAYQALDGNPATSWHQPKSQAMPTDLVIDLGKEETLTGFRYLPAQNWWEEGSIITHYQFEVSADNQTWKRVSEGEFSNIKNSPFWQTKTFEPTKARYINLRALKNTQDGSASGYAEVDVITK